MAIILYARKSIENEVSISCETQLEYCRSMLRPDERREEIIEIVDNGCSGGNMEREGFRRMMTLVQENSVSKVIVYKLDRFSRSFVDFANSMEIFRKHRVKFISSQEAFDTGSAYGEMVMQILMVFAQFERSSIIDRITQAYAHRSEMGFYMGGNCPYGFQLIPWEIHGIRTKKLQPLPEEAAVVQKIFSIYAEKHISLRRLQTMLIEENRNDGQWTTSKLSSLLKNPIYVRADSEIYGYFEERGVQIKSELALFDGSCGAQLYGRSKHDPSLSDWSDMKLVLLSHEGLVDSDTWLKCQHKLERNRQFGSSFSNGTSWLAGKVVCASCGHGMTTVKGSPRKDGQIRRYFNCTGKSHRKICSGPQVTIHAEELEALMENCIAEKLSALNIVPQTPKTNSDMVNRLKLKLKAIEQSEKQLLESMLSDGFNEALLALANQKATQLQQERLALTKQIRLLQQDDTENSPPPDLPQAWKTAEYIQKKSVAMLLLHKILIHEDGSAEVLWNI